MNTTSGMTFCLMKNFLFELINKEPIKKRRNIDYLNFSCTFVRKVSSNKLITMIIFNTTYHVDNSVLDDFIQFLTTEFIPVATSDKELSNPRLTKVMTQEVQEGSSIALQFEIADLDKLDDWYEQVGDSLNNDLVTRFGSQVVGFSTLLEVIEF